MKIVYVTIATGNYKIFIDELISSGTVNFFPNCETDFIILTDSEEHLANKLPNVKFIEQKRLGFPYDTLKRYHLINQLNDQLELDYDYLFFGNVNMVFNEPVTETILPTEHQNGLVGVAHPGYYNTNPQQHPYERNAQSTAYIAFGQEGSTYYQGCFFGGDRMSFLKMTEVLQNRVDVDLDNGIIALWWDESHLNKYFIKNPPKKLDPGYAYADAYDISQFRRMITQLDKRKFYVKLTTDDFYYTTSYRS